MYSASGCKCTCSEVEVDAFFQLNALAIQHQFQHAAVLLHLFLQRFQLPAPQQKLHPFPHPHLQTLHTVPFPLDVHSRPDQL